MGTQDDFNRAGQRPASLTVSKSARCAREQQPHSLILGTRGERSAREQFAFRSLREERANGFQTEMNR